VNLVNVSTDARAKSGLKLLKAASARVANAGVSTDARAKSGLKLSHNQVGPSQATVVSTDARAKSGLKRISFSSSAPSPSCLNRCPR